MSYIDATYIVTGEDLLPLVYDEDGDALECVTESEAVKQATLELAKLGDDSEVWIWKLSHVLTKDVSLNIEDVA